MPDRNEFEYIEQQDPFSHSSEPFRRRSLRDALQRARNLRRLGKTTQPFVVAALKKQEEVEQRRKDGNIVDAASTLVRIDPRLDASLREHGPQNSAEAHIQRLRDQAELDFLGDPQSAGGFDPVDPQAVTDAIKRMLKPNHIDPTQQ